MLQVDQGPHSPHTQFVVCAPHSQSAHGRYSTFLPGHSSHAGIPTSQVCATSMGINVFLQAVAGAWSSCAEVRPRAPMSISVFVRVAMSLMATGNPASKQTRTLHEWCGFANIPLEASEEEGPRTK